MKLSNFSGKTIAIMVASGFDETGFIAIQRAMLNAGAKLRIVSREAGLTNAWNGTGWGMSYPADSTLSTALAIDLDTSFALLQSLVVLLVGTAVTDQGPNVAEEVLPEDVRNLVDQFSAKPLFVNTARHIIAGVRADALSHLGVDA